MGFSVWRFGLVQFKAVWVDFSGGLDRFRAVWFGLWRFGSVWFGLGWFDKINYIKYI